MTAIIVVAIVVAIFVAALIGGVALTILIELLTGDNDAPR
jgi:hypothetical protein